MLRRRFFGIVIGALAIISLWVGLAVTPPCSAQADAAEKGIARALAVQTRHTNGLMTKNGVVGTAVGLDAQGRHVVKVYVADPQDAAGIAKQLDGVPVAVQVTGILFALKPPSGKGPPSGGGGNVDPTARFARPVPIGVSTGHPAITAGTIGCRVTDGTEVYALSNNHVYANQDAAQVPDPVVQPGTYDGGRSPADDIGFLFDFESISLDSENVMDAAIASTTTAFVGNSTPSNGYGTPRSTTAVASVGMKVLKYGRTTSQTEGRIDGVNATVDVLYDRGVARFVGQIIITPGGFSAGGDSGSLIVVTDKKGKNERPDHLKPVGLLFAGSNVVTIANPIDVVLARFGVTVDGN